MFCSLSSVSLLASLLYSASFLIPSASALPPTNYAPSTHIQARSHCRCVTISSVAPQSSVLLEASRSRHWHCAELGPKLEYWKKTNPDDFHGLWEGLFGTENPNPNAAMPTSVLDSDKPLPTNVLMELSMRRPTPSGGEQRIVCRARSEEDGDDSDDEWTDHGLAVLVFFIVMLVLGCVAEIIELVLTRTNFFPWRHRPISLPGSEKALKAFQDWTTVENDKTSEEEQRDIFDRPAL